MSLRDATARPEYPFTDVSSKALPELPLVCGGPEKRSIIETNGGGLGLADLNGDGPLDLVVVQGSTLEAMRSGKAQHAPHVLLGRGDGTFRLAPKEWSMEALPFGSGVVLGDVNGDGWCDGVALSWNGIHLYLNQAGQGWERVQESGFEGAAVRGWWTSGALFDADGDGHLDLFAARYLQFDPQAAPDHGEQGARWKGHAVMFGPEGYAPQADQIFWGDGQGRFTLEKEHGGLGPSQPGFGLGVVARDVDGDGDTDLHVANDSTANHLWINDGRGRFEEKGFAAGVSHGPNGREQAGMGIACATLPGQDRPSFFVTNFSGESNAFYQPSRRSGSQSGRRPGRYRERSSARGIAGTSRPWLGWGTGFFDWDLDGQLDLWVLNGHVYPEADRPGTDTRYAQPDQLLRPDAQGRYQVQALHAGPDRVSRTGVAGDLDGDGDEDLVVWTQSGGLQVLQNNAPSHGNWVGLDLRLANGASLPPGSQVTVECGAHRVTLEWQRSAGFQASRPARRVVAVPAGESPILISVTGPAPLRRQASFEAARGQWNRWVWQP